jgi:hypothetical protein
MLTNEQINIILSKTPKKYIKTRPAKGGGTWDFVSVSYITKCLNLMFGWDWDFEIIDEQILDRQVIVKGKLTCRVGDRQIVKMQYGRKDIVKKKNSDIPLDVGNDLKAAASDSLKKCASSIGIAADIYGGDDFKEVKVSSPDLDEVTAKKEFERISKWILDAKTSEDLEEAKKYVNTPELQELYDKRFNELNISQ